MTFQSIQRFILLSLLITTFASAGEFDKFTKDKILSMPTAKLEAIYLKEKCPNEQCEFVFTNTNDHNLSLAERLAIWHYTASEYMNITPALYQGELDNSQLAFVRILDSALVKIPSSKATVYRGTSKTTPVKIGTVIDFKSYTSTSTDKYTAEGFIRDRFMIIKSKSGKDIMDYSNAGQERELLLPRGTKVRVDKISKKKMEIGEDPSDMQTINVEIVHATEI